MSGTVAAPAPAWWHRVTPVPVWAWALVGLLLAGTAALLLSMGRPPICTCGTVKLWVGTVNGPDNSQHLADWYTPSHVIHGLIFYALAAWALGGRLGDRLGASAKAGVQLLLAVAVEAAWEVAENSPVIIDRYRQATMALGYTGDSVINSIADVAWMMLGFALARRLPVRVTVGLALVFETITLLLIRDGLALNVLMLVWPVEGIREWQAGL